jgi:hypothetical protein
VRRGKLERSFAPAMWQVWVGPNIPFVKTQWRHCESDDWAEASCVGKAARSFAAGEGSVALTMRYALTLSATIIAPRAFVPSANRSLYIDVPRSARCVPLRMWDGVWRSI